jgi:threonine/homoserine/homoserine lactone efflux protein
MDLLTFFRGAVIGLSIGAPLGPVGLICLRRLLNQGVVPGLISGLGAATADAAFGAITGFGLTFLTGPLMSHQGWLRMTGGIVLCALGVRCFFTRPRLVIDGGARPGRGGLLRAYTSILLLTFTSPATVLSFLALFAALGGVDEAGRLSVGLLVLGVFVGSAFWWIVLATGTGALRHHLTPNGLRWVNRLSGALLAAFGIAVLAFGVGTR